MNRLWKVLCTLALPLSLSGCAVGLDFSPDGRSIAAVTTKGLAILSVDGRSRTPVPQGEHGVMPLWSPDGKYILFMTQKDDGNMEGLHLYDVAAGTSTEIGKGYDLPLAWREDSRRFAAVHTTNAGWELVAYNLQERGVTLRTKLPRSPNGPVMVWLPGTDDVAFLAGQNDVMDVYTAEAGEVHKITTTGDVIGLALSADRTKLLWARRGPNPKYLLMSVYAWDITDRKAVRLPLPERIPPINPDARHAPTSVEYAAFAPDGSRFALLAEFGGTTPGHGDAPGAYGALYSVKMDGSEAHLVCRTPIQKQGGGFMWPAWSRDGKRLAVQNMREKVLQTLLFDPVGGPATTLLSEKAE